jgi:hypothetical protein
LKIALGFLALLVIAIVVLLVVADKENKRQSEVLTEEFKAIVDFVLQIPINIAKDVTNIATALTKLSRDVQDVIDETGSTSDLTKIKDDLSATEASFKKIKDDMASITESLQDFKNGQIFKDIEDYDSQRSQVFMGVLLIPCLFLICTLAILLWNAIYRIKHKNYLKDSYAEVEPKCAPWKCCNCCVSPCLSAILLFLILLIFITSTILMAITTVSADTCENPYEDIVVLGDLSGDSAFFLTCSPTSGPQNIPSVQSALDSITGLEGTLLNATAEMADECNSKGLPASALEKCLEAVQEFNTTFYNSYLGVLKPVLQGRIGCKEIQSRINALFNIFCIGIYDTLYNAFALFLALGSIIVIGEALRRLVPIDMDDNDEDVVTANNEKAAEEFQLQQMMSNNNNNNSNNNNNTDNNSSDSNADPDSLIIDQTPPHHKPTYFQASNCSVQAPPAYPADYPAEKSDYEEPSSSNPFEETDKRSTMISMGSTTDSTTLDEPAYVDS